MLHRERETEVDRDQGTSAQAKREVGVQREEDGCVERGRGGVGTGSKRDMK